ncbi:uncharacterized protein K02A2.6-like [Ornithodoros turicata]|uniref:uncharacterized protein K02A2.6-like n=1 Tax=Ornithodoros turicata TaxID=34597 RepID=UPI003139E037
MPTFGRIEPFEGGGDEWPSYVERLQAFFEANDVGNDKKRAIFFSSCGQKTYSLLRDLLKPAAPQDKSLDEVLEVLGKHYCPKPSEVVQRFRFNSRVRTKGESVSDFVAALKSLSEHCSFGSELENMLRDRVVCGIDNQEIQTRLLEQPSLTFKSAVQTALAMEAAKSDAGEICQASTSSSFPTHRVVSVGEVTCFRCGDGHLANQCKYASSICNFCRKRGHLARVCHSKHKNTSAHKHFQEPAGRRSSPKGLRVKKVKTFGQRPFPVNAVGEDEDVETSSEVFDMWHLSDDALSPPPPFTVVVNVCDKPLPMEVDTGASVSVMSKNNFQQLLPDVTVNPSKVLLRSYTGELSQVQGQANVCVQFCDKSAVLPLFLTGDRSPTLLGRNWIQQLGIGIADVEVNKCSLSDVKSLIHEYSEVFSNGLGQYKGPAATIHVLEGSLPKFFKPRPLPFALKEGVTQELQRLQRDGVLVPVKSSEWAAPIVPVPKKDGRVRVCGDFKVTVNPVTQLEKYPIPRIEDLWNTLSGGEKFTKLDLRDAYQQVILAEESRRYVTISTHIGLFQYTRLPFGVSSAPAIFQREMENLFRGLPHVAVYFDDILVTGRNDTEHMRNLHCVLARLRDVGLKLKFDKCHFFVPEVNYLGHIISKEGLSPDKSKVEAISKAPAPRDVKELQSYLGLINFYRRFLPNLSSCLRPLYLLLTAGKRWEWGRAQEDAFNESKRLMLSAPILAHFDPAKPLYLSCDASPYGVGAVISQKEADGRERPIAFASRSLSEAEQRYSQLDKEALALVFGTERFHQYLWGMFFRAYTDHKPLLGLLGANKPIPVQASPRLVRWALKLSTYQYELLYKPGRDLLHADALSRLPLPACQEQSTVPAEVFMLEQAYSDLLTPTVVARATKNDPVLSQVFLALSRGEVISLGPEGYPYSARSAELSLHEGCVLWGARAVIPKALQSRVLKMLHAGHPGIEKSKKIARSHVWWPGIDNDIMGNVKACSICQSLQRTPRPAQQTPWPFPQRPWSRLHVDFGGPFLGHTFLVIVDAYSKWVEVFPVKSTSAESTIDVLRLVFAQHGLPDLIVSDNGPAFASAQYLDFLTRNGIRRMLVPPYHPASNGAAERVVQTVKNKLKKSAPGCFKTQIARFLFQYRTTPHEVTGRAPCELLTGRMFKTPLDVLRPSLHSSVHFKQLKQKLHADEGCRRGPPFEATDDVFARDFRRGAAWVPARVVGTLSNSSAAVTVEDGSTWHRHNDHLRPRVPAMGEVVPPRVEPQPAVVAETPVNEGTTAADVGQSFAQQLDRPAGGNGTVDSSVESKTPLRRSKRTVKPVQRYSPQ